MSRVRNVSVVPKLIYGFLGYFGAGIYTVIITLTFLFVFGIILPEVGIINQNPFFEVTGSEVITLSVQDYLSGDAGILSMGTILFIVTLWPVIATIFFFVFLELFQAAVLFDILSVISVIIVFIFGGIMPVVVNYFIYLLYKKR